ncbi:MAG: DNA polymerase III subunit beta, partial [Dehalococcoidia bacterium]|nr:DNA polymerase III subunit beta [Dehalococcoidia bacterium]
MEIQVSKLREALKLLEPVVPKKAILPVIGYVYLGNGRAMATNLEIAVKVDLPEASEKMLIPVMAALDFLETIPGHRMVTVTVKGKNVVLTSGSMEAEYTTEDPEDFPPIERGDFEHDAVLNGEALVKALVTVWDCSAKEDTRVVLHGVCLTTGDDIAAVGADGFQLAVEKIQGKLPGDKPLIIPREAVRFIERLWSKAAAPDLTGVETPAQLAMAKRPIRLEYNSDALQLHFGRVTMLIKLTQGTFPNYTQLIPTGFTSSVTVWAEDFKRVLKAVGKLARNSSGITRLEWSEEKLKVSARAEEYGSSSGSIGAKCTAPGRIAFNITYLENWLAPLQGEVTISTSSPSSPGLFSSRSSIRVIMPMHVQWDGDGGAKTEAPAEPVEPTD